MALAIVSNMSRLQNWKGVFLLGVTGSMGSGKSFVTTLLEKAGCQRVNSDELARRYTAPDTPILQELIELFGEDILEKPNTPDRKKIAAIVFQDKSKLASLTNLIHPRIRQELVQKIQTFAEGSVVAWEAPILFEAEADVICHSILTVHADLETCFQRAQKRDGLTREEFDSRMRNQMDIKEKIKRSDFIIENTTQTSEELERECKKILIRIREFYNP